jgi:hypothetical protein
VEARNSWHRNIRDRKKSSFTAAATLLGIYTALYLAFAGLVHFMTSPDAAAAIVPESATAAPTVTAEPAETTRAVGGSIATRPLVPATDETDNARECLLEAGIDSACIFD